MIVKILKRNEFIKNSLILISGTTLAQVIPIVFSPVISRLYNPSDFAIFGLFFSVVSIVSSIAAGTFEFAVVLPEKDSEATNLVALSAMITGFSAIISFMFISIFKSQIGYLLNNHELSNWIMLAPVSILFLTMNSILGFWFNREKKFMLISLNKVIRNSMIAFSNIILGVTEFIKGGLVIGQLLGDFVASILLFFRFLKGNLQLSGISIKKMRTVAIKHKKFPIYTLTSTLLGSLSLQLPILLISSWFDPTVTGSYFFSSRILAIPISLISSSVAQVFYQKFVEVIRDNAKSARKFLIKVWAILFAIGVVPFTILLFFGETLFGLVFGPDWIQAGKITALLAPMILFMFISSPTSSTYIVLGKQHVSVFFSFATVIYRPLAIYIGYINNSLLTGLKLLVLFEITSIIIYNLLIFKYLKTENQLVDQ